jgi:uncharacterized protein (DUF2267 family)
MQYDEFIGRVQQRARLAWRGDAEAATDAVLTTLGERLAGGEAGDLAGQLPERLQTALAPGADRQVSYSLDEFFQRVSDREGADLPDAVFHARAVVEVLTEAVSEGQIRHVRDQLPEEYDPLFGGAEGKMRAA